MGKPKRVIDVDIYEEDKKETKRHSEKTDDNKDNNNNANNNFDFSNIDFNQLSGLLQNVDLSQISSLLGGLGGMSGGGQGLLGSIGNIAKMMGAPSQVSAEPMVNTPYRGDRRLEVLGALKPMVSPERATLIDMIIQVYVISKILRR